MQITATMQSLEVKVTCYVLVFVLGNTVSSKWSSFSTSSNYENMRLVTESVNPFQPVNISKAESSTLSARLTCSVLCSNNVTCLGFNFYPTPSHYVCELLAVNFCTKDPRKALYGWPGGIVWDKLLSGMKKACIDQQFDKNTTTDYCQIGRSGCRSGSNTTSAVWPGCDDCVKTCIDCTIFYNFTGINNCILWPEGSSQPPIFTSCTGNGTYLLKRGVDPTTGQITRNYRMSLEDIHRLSRLDVYKQIQFAFKSDKKSYYISYKNFYIDEDGALMNMTAVSAVGDGFNLLNQSLKRSPWVEADSSCGPFWYLNSTQPSATMQCPGGGISVLGKVDITTSPATTGINWPDPTINDSVFNYVDVWIFE